MKNLKNLEKIANRNGGNRAFGLPGYAESVDFITDRLAKLSKTSTFYVQDFPALFAEVKSISLVVDEVDYYIFGLQYSPSTSAEGLTLPLVLGPSGPAGCTVDGYEGFDVTGKIVLVERGTCPTGGTLAGRIRPAAAAGAAGVIIYNNVDAHVTGGTLSAPDPDNFVPGGYIDRVDGLALVEKVNAGEVTAFFQQTQDFETRITQNIIAETNGGDPNNVVMLGAHLDSVQAGPGINDDGSGTSLILEIFTALNSYQTNLKVRAAWWAAEENGLLGSRYYVSSLSPTNVSSLLTYLNFDMVSKGFFGVFDGDGSTYGLVAPPGSETIEKLFVDDLISKGLPVTPAAFTGGSDYVAFLDVLRKPVGGLFTGTGEAQDPCYHQACDTYANPNATVLTINAKTAAHVVATLALDGTKLIPKSNSTVGRRERMGEMEIRATEWTILEGQEGHSALCGAHDH
ncbi:leucine aminopeptidase 2-like protein 1 [Phlyctema vagabunda]|uniref:Peptide hydrolase n=1 Tax=Phlyctema vagabunda TaxID=108571 RepID=A0ABR4P197_9HELO